MQTKPKALVVEDDERVIESVEDFMVSIGHDFEWVMSLKDAQDKLQTERFDYALLDLQIPARFGGAADVSFGVRLVEHINERFEANGCPVVMMTGYAEDGLELSSRLQSLGVVGFVSKPIQTKIQRLTELVRGALALRNAGAQRVPKTGVPVGHENKPPTKFNGGEVVYYADRVTLLDVDICLFDKKGKYRQCLDLFRQRNSSTGNFIGNSSQGLQKKIGFASQNDAIKTIGILRRHISERLREELNCECGEQDVIPNDRKNGYRFAKWITVRDADDQGHDQGHQGHDQGHEQGHLQGHQGHDQGHEQGHQGHLLGHQGHLQGHQGHDQGHEQGHQGHILGHQGHLQGHQGHDQGHDGDRRSRILTELKRERLRAPDLAARLGCSPKTIKRDLDTLKAEGVVAFVGPPRTGYYAIAAK